MYGVDFGTSNTVVCASGLPAPGLLSFGGSPVVPTLLFFEKDGQPRIGQDAMLAYSEALQLGAGHRHDRFRFIQAIKLALKNPSFAGTRIFGQFWPAESLAGLFLKELKRQADEQCGRDERALVLGRPVRLGATVEEDLAIQQRFRAAADFAGFSDISFVLEPVGALVATGRAHAEQQTTLIFDFGGGTLDLTIARKTAGQLEILANQGTDLGGYTINEAIARARIIGHFGFNGKFRTMTGRWLDIPAWITDQVASFYALPLAEIAKTRQAVKDLVPEARASDKNKLKGLLDFLDLNQSFRLFNCIDEAKIQLSTEAWAEVIYKLDPYIHIQETLQRAWYEELLTPHVRTARVLIEATLGSAGCAAETVNKVVRVGGSSRIPAFVELLEAMFPGKVSEGAVFTSIAEGLLQAKTLNLTC